MNREIEKTGTERREDHVLVPPIDIYATDDEYVIKADMPSVKKEDLDITLHDNKLEISGKVTDSGNGTNEVKYREYVMYDYYRNFQVGNDIDNNGISAEIADGVLTLKLPKRAESKPKKITINAE